MGRTLQMFDRPKTPRVVRMHVTDAGIREDGAEIAVYKCSKCGHETGWTEFKNITEAKRGIPCPQCNGFTEHDWTGPTQTNRHVHCARCGKIFEVLKPNGQCTGRPDEVSDVSP